MIERGNEDFGENVATVLEELYKPLEICNKKYKKN